MIKAVLLDLDDTLLINPTLRFMQVYMQQFERYTAEHWGLESLRDHLMSAGRGVMFDARDMQQSNLSVMLESLSQSTGRAPDELLAMFRDFFTSPAFESVRECTGVVPAAAKIVQRLKEQGYMVVIATNPIYIAEAIQRRLNWAGLSDNLCDYAFVTHAENMHFAKPHPAYYAEILGRVGIEPDEALMVGDDTRNDIAPAENVGLYTRQITPATLHKFLDEIPTLDDLPNRGPQPESIVPQLSGNVGALYGLIDTAKPHFWHQRPDPREWSPLQIVCHLLDKENDVMRPRLQKIMQEDRPFLAETLPTEPQEASVCAPDGPTAAHTFTESRRRTIALVESFSAADWQRPARHSIFGHTTLLEMAHFTAQHDRLHLRQLCQTIGRCQ